MAVWYFGKPDIPIRSLVIAFGMLTVPVAATFLFPGSSGDYQVILWLLALLPAFLLAYYRGWIGVAVAMLVGMAVLSIVQIVVFAFDIQTDWLLLLSVILAYISLGLALGIISEVLHKERAQAERLALMDDLTQMPNRRLADLFLEKEFAAARRGRPVTVILFDLDRFKAYNDRFGHAAGDRALQKFVGMVSGRTRTMDLSARYGGEEFVAVLSGGITDSGVRFAESVRKALADSDDDLPPFTVSAGVAEYTEDMGSPTDLVEAADRALYRAKETGRDQVVTYASMQREAEAEPTPSAVPGA